MKKDTIRIYYCIIYWMQKRVRTWEVQAHSIVSASTSILLYSCRLHSSHKIMQRCTIIESSCLKLNNCIPFNFRPVFCLVHAISHKPWSANGFRTMSLQVSLGVLKPNLCEKPEEYCRMQLKSWPKNELLSHISLTKALFACLFSEKVIKICSHQTTLFLKGGN